jgi:hypothetical protein
VTGYFDVQALRRWDYEVVCVGVVELHRKVRQAIEDIGACVAHIERLETRNVLMEKTLKQIAASPCAALAIPCASLPAKVQCPGCLARTAVSRIRF